MRKFGKVGMYVFVSFFMKFSDKNGYTRKNERAQVDMNVGVYLGNTLECSRLIMLGL